MARILITDDEAATRETLQDLLEAPGVSVSTAAHGQEAVHLLDEKAFDLLLTDLRMPEMDGIELLRHVRGRYPDLPVLLLTSHGDVETAVEAMKLGARDFLEKPVSLRRLKALVEGILEHRSLLNLREHTRRDHEASDVPLSHGAPCMEELVQRLRKAAPQDTTLLITGESGTGKEVAARAAHRWSRRAKGPFVAVNCAALPAALIESELFGHEKGAFTGATERRQGRLELARGGTVFLDEIGELRPELQAKLLRVIEYRSFERVGGARTFEADVRWIAATNCDLSHMVQEGSFRDDLYHRIAVFPIRIPPLRERRGEIRALAHTLLGRISRQMGYGDAMIEEDALTHLDTHDWPGNVRELANTLERALILSEGAPIRSCHIDIMAPTPAREPQGMEQVEHAEQRAIEEALRAEGGNRRRAAERLGIGLRTLYTKLKRHGIE